LALGVTLGGFALSMAGAITGRGEDAAINFTFAFLTVGLLSMGSAWQMRQLRPDAAAQMAGRAHAGRGVAEPKPESRPPSQPPARAPHLAETASRGPPPSASTVRTAPAPEPHAI